MLNKEELEKLHIHDLSDLILFCSKVYKNKADAINLDKFIYELSLILDIKEAYYEKVDDIYWKKK